MNRVAVIIVTLAVVAGSVPAAAALADGTSGQPSGEEPGAAFAGVVGVQQAEVDNEVAQRSLSQQFEAAGSNDSKARVVADQSERLTERLNKLEAEKERLKQARENGSIEQGEYEARLAALAAEIRAVEQRANQTADVAERLPEQALRDNGANVSEVRKIAQQANRTGGGDVAEAARSIAGEGVGNGLGGPPNGSERGPPEGAGPSGDAGPNDNTTDANPGVGNGNGPGENVTGKPEGAGPGTNSTAGNASGNGPGNAPANGTDRGQNVTGGPGDGPAPRSNTTGGNASVPGGNGTVGNDAAGNGASVGNGTAGGNGAANTTDQGNSAQNVTGTNETVPGGNDTGATGIGPTGTDGLNEGTGSDDGDVSLDGTETESTATATPSA